MPGSLELRAPRAGPAALAGVIAVAAGYGVLHPGFLSAVAAALGLALLLVIPIEAGALVAVALSNGAAGYFEFLEESKGVAAAAAVAGVVVLRSLLTSDLSRAQLGAGLAVAAVFGLGAANALVGETLGAAPADVVRAALPFTLLALVLVAVPRHRVPQLLAWMAGAASILSALYVASAVTGEFLVPGVVRAEPEAFAGHEITRIWAPGGLLAVYGAIWGVVQLATGTRRRGFSFWVVASCGGAALATLSRGVLLGLVLALAVASLALANSRRNRGRAVAIAVVLAAVLTVSGSVLNPRTAATYTEISDRTGSFGARVDQIRERSDTVREHPWLGVGFAQGDYDLADSGVFTIIARFGVAGLAAAAATVLVAASHIGALRRAGTEERRLAAVAGALLAFYGATAFTLDALISPGGLAVLALVLGLVLSADRPRTQEAAA